MKKIELVEIRQVNDALAEMVALFRVELRSFKGIAISSALPCSAAATPCRRYSSLTKMDSTHTTSLSIRQWQERETMKKIELVEIRQVNDALAEMVAP